MVKSSAIESVREAIDAHIELLVEDGIRRIDQFVAAHPEYGSRSGFLSRVAADRVISRENR